MSTGTATQIKNRICLMHPHRERDMHINNGLCFVFLGSKKESQWWYPDERFIPSYMNMGGLKMGNMGGLHMGLPGGL